MDIVSTNQIIKLCAKSLRYYDEMLVEHGERVARIAYEIAKNTDEDIDVKTLVLLCVFHDIGAYKTEEITRMLNFETTNVQAHAIYGYLFLKYFTPLKDYAQAILYHHTDDNKFDGVDPKIKKYAQLIYLADRVDIALVNGHQDDIMSMVDVKKFNKDLVNALGKTLQKIDVSTFKSNELAYSFIANFMENSSFEKEEAVEYLKMLVFLCDFKSEFTVVHSVNTTIISLFIAYLLKFDEAQMNKIYYGALVHDVGKLAIPVEILEYPGKLSSEQMEIMKQHVVLTREILQGVLPDEIVEIASRHHEKLNGSGYPLGLTEKDLTLSQRILAVADLISALGNKRSYKDAFSKEKIIAIAVSEAENNKIDKNIVNLVVDNFDQLKKVMDEHTQPIKVAYENIQKEYNHFYKHKEFL